MSNLAQSAILMCIYSLPGLCTIPHLHGMHFRCRLSKGIGMWARSLCILIEKLWFGRGRCFRMRYMNNVNSGISTQQFQGHGSAKKSAYTFGWVKTPIAHMYL
jgi:hypothetical protein